MSQGVRKNVGKRSSFASLLPEELDHLASICTPRQLPAGGVLFREGDPGDAMFVVVGGRVQGSIAGPEGNVVLNILRAVGVLPGETVDEVRISRGRRLAIGFC